MMPNPPIFAPTFHGKVAAVRKLLKEDASIVNDRDAKNLTPIHVAASRGQHKVIELLLEYGADIEGPTEPDSWTPLVFAAYRGHLEAVKVLIDNGAAVGGQEDNSIHFAGQRKHKEICRLLVEQGAIDDLIDSNAPQVLRLFRAAYSFDAERVKEILTERPDLVNETDKHGRTALHEACTHGDTKTVRALLKFGCDASVEDENGQTAADRAAAHRQHAVTKILDQHQRAT